MPRLAPPAACRAVCKNGQCDTSLWSHWPLGTSGGSFTFNKRASKASAKPVLPWPSQCNSHILILHILDVPLGSFSTRVLVACVPKATREFQEAHKCQRAAPQATAGPHNKHHTAVAFTDFLLKRLALSRPACWCHLFNFGMARVGSGVVTAPRALAGRGRDLGNLHFPPGYR